MSDVEQIPVCPIGDKHPAADKTGRHATGHRLCENHFEGLGKLLREIETESRDLDAIPSIAIHWNTGGGGHSGGGSPAFEQAPARLDPLVLTDRRQGRGDSEDLVERHAAGRTEPVLVVLATYASRVRTERGFPIPMTSWVDRMPGCLDYGPTCRLPCRHDTCQGIAWWRSAPKPSTIRSERDLLTKQLPWLANWPDIDVVFSRLRRLLSQLRQANGTAQHPMGKCPAPRSDAGDTCGGPLWPVKPTHTTGEWKGSSPSAVRCEGCGTRWEGPGELARLALILEQQRKARA